MLFRSSAQPGQVPTLVAAARGQEVPHTPVWFMRQAGRSLPEYRALREGNAMLEACRTPELCTEITLQPVRRHDVDAAILFSDIVVPLKAAGVAVEIVPGRGPVMDKAIESRQDVDKLPMLEEDVPEVAAGIPLGRLGVPEEVANVVTMLVTTGYMTGQSLLLGGGLK